VELSDDHDGHNTRPSNLPAASQATTTGTFVHGHDLYISALFVMLHFLQYIFFFVNYLLFLVCNVVVFFMRRYVYILVFLISI
jgi:hypothetical protein